MPDALLKQEKFLIVSQFPLFAELSARDRKEVASAAVLVEHKKGDVIYREGDPPDALYCVITGRLRAFITRSGMTEDLEYLKRGKYFGMISLLTEEPHSVTVQAVNDSIILKIARDDFQGILKRVPDIGIHLGLTLSRRLKSKDIHEKRVFESTIISVYGVPDGGEGPSYAVSLSAGLKAQTRKKVILVEASADGGVVLEPSPADRNLIDKNICARSDGTETIRISRSKNTTSQFVTALSYLTNDYHYIVASLTGQPDEFITETLRQSDVVHIVAAGDEPHLKMAAGLIGSLESSSGESDSRVRVIVSESGAAKRMTSSERTAVLKHPIYATLPEADTSEDSEYSRVIRRIAREIGERLIGLALGSGAALSMAHIGILKVIEKENIPIDIVVGTSMGAVIGALWASGKSGSDMERIMGAFKKKIQTFRMIDLTFPSKGVLKGREVKRFLVSFFGKTTFRDLRMPFKVVCCDIETREEVVLEDGSLADAVMASVAIPGAFEPVMIGGRMLVDGGIINPLATSVLMKRGVSKIIAVNTLPSPEDIQQSKKKVTNILDIIVNTLQASEYLLAEMSCQDVDIAMHPILPTVDWYEFYEYPRVIERGVQEALKFLPQLRELASA